MNPLVIYIFQALLLAAHEDSVPSDLSLPWALLLFLGFYLCCYAVAWRLWKDKVIIKI
jgi:hypothetical protein